LYSGARLAVCREWVAAHRDELNPIELAFVAVSEEAERQRAQDELDKERRRRAEAEATVRRQRQLGRRWRIASILALALAVTAGVMAWWASEAREDANKAAQKAEAKEKEAKAQEKEAKAQAHISDSRRLAALSLVERDQHLDLALLLAVEALRIE